MEKVQTRWIKASEALDLLAETRGSRQLVKEELADLLRDDKLSSHVARTWIDEQPGLSFKMPPIPTELEENIVVPASYWRGASNCWISDQQRWRWPGDSAVVTIRRKPIQRRIFRGLRFLQTDIDRLLGPRLAPQTGTKRGQKTAAAKWGLVASKLVHLIEHGELAGQEKPSVNSIQERLQILTNDAFGKTSLGEFAAEFLKHYSPPK